MTITRELLISTMQQHLLAQVGSARVHIAGFAAAADAIVAQCNPALSHIDAEIADHRNLLGEAVSDNNYQEAASAQIAIEALDSVRTRITAHG